MAIPKRIITMWLTFEPGPWPRLVNRCIESQKIPGYEHHIITLDNCYKGSKYVNEALAKAKRLYEEGNRKDDVTKKAATWLVKASDWLRCYHTWEMGGIYLDADMEVLPGKNFDDLLDCGMFTENEVLNCTANAGFGAEKGHPFLKEYIDRIEDNFRGDGLMVFEPGIRAFSDIMWYADKEKDRIKILETSMFFPYNHATGEIKIAPNTRVFHHYANTWCHEQKLNKLGTEWEDRKFF